MRSFILLALCLLATRFTAQAQSNKAWCDLKGAVFVITEQSQADYRVYEEKAEGLADMPVFKAPNLLFADRSGLWFFTQTRAQAAFTICFVKERAMADFSVYYLDNESFAGCR